MKDRTALQLSLSGSFTGEDLGEGRWRLVGAATTGVADASEVYLRGAGPGAAAILSTTGITRLDLEWRPSGVTVLVSGHRGIQRIEAHGAIVHQPASQLYQALPLAGFDRKARQFWSRVFVLMRIPGGRLLLRLFAQRRR